MIKIDGVDLTIGTKVYAVFKQYVDKKMSGGRVKVCKVKTFMNKQGEILPVLTEIGNSKREFDTDSHHIYYGLSEAVEAIRTKKEKK